jgi:hypothetical protein
MGEKEGIFSDCCKSTNLKLDNSQRMRTNTQDNEKRLQKLDKAISETETFLEKDSGV